MAVDPAVALISLTKVKTFLKISGVTEDSLLEVLINRASTLAATYCGRNLVSKEYTEYHDGSGDDTLLLNNYPVTAIASLHDDHARDFSSSSEVAAGDRMMEGAAGIVRLWNSRTVFGRGKANVKIVYTAGYVLDSTVPADLEHAVQLIVLYMYKRHYQDQKVGISSESIGDRNTTFETTDIPNSAAKILDHYRAAPQDGHAY